MRQAAAQGVSFIDLLASYAGTSMGERRACVPFALLGVRCATIKGDCALINGRPPLRRSTGSSCHGFLPLAEPKCRLRPPGLANSQPGTLPLPPPFPPRLATGGAPSLLHCTFPPLSPPFTAAPFELELELIKSQMAQKPMLRQKHTRVRSRESKRSESRGVGRRPMRLMGRRGVGSAGGLCGAPSRRF
jgi:hypothetical protein